MQTLDVVNTMLGTMGEKPLNSLNDPHSYRGACLSTLSRINKQVQAKGYWFNREYLTLQPSALNGHIYLPGDFINVEVPRSPTRDTTQIVQRGRRLYNTEGGVYTFDHAVDVILIRLVPFEDLPEAAAQHIAAMAVYQFQTEYDGDTAKGRQLEDRISNPTTGTLGAFNTENIRNERTNFLRSNYKLQRLKAITNGARRWIR